MIIRYILINTCPEHEHKVYNYLVNEPDIIELNPLFKSNSFDLIAKIDFKNKSSIRKYILENIRSLPGVVDSKIL